MDLEIVVCFAELREGMRRARSKAINWTSRKLRVMREITDQLSSQQGAVCKEVYSNIMTQVYVQVVPN